MDAEGTIRKCRIEIVSIFASMGGLVSLTDILQQIPPDFPVPIVYHQPVLPSRRHDLRERIALNTDLHVTWLSDGRKLRPGHLYLCPGTFWVVIDKGVVSMIPLMMEGRAQSGVELAGSLIGSYHNGCALVLLKEADASRGAAMLRRFEKSGVIFSECGDFMSADKLFGLGLPLREIVPSLLTVLSQSCMFTPREDPASSPSGRRASAELRGFLRGLVALPMRIHGTPMGTVQLFDSADGTLHVAAQKGFDREFLRSFWVTGSDGMWASARAARDKRTIMIEDIYAEESYAPYRTAAAEAGYAAVQATPMISSGGKLMGVLSTYFGKPHHLTRGQLRTVELYAGVAADVLERLTFHAGQSTLFVGQDAK
jgi:hypothetical protein